MAILKARGSRSLPRGLRWRSSTLFILSTVAVGMYTDLFLYALIVPVIPFILSDRLSVPHSEIQSYTSILLACYAAASVAFSLPAGFIADRLQARQLPFLLGLGTLTVASILLYLGQSILVLILARILQGISAAVVWTVGMALVMDTVGSDRLGVVIGTIFSVISTGELLAPVIGGVVYRKAGYGAVFAIGIVLLVIDFAMRILVIEKKVAAQYNLPGSPEASDSDEGNSRDEDEASDESPLLGKKDDLEDWKLPEDRPNWAQTLPIIYLMRNPRLVCASVASFTQAAILGAFDATITTEAQDLFGFDSLKAGLSFIPLALPALAVGPLAGRAADRYGTKPVSVIGFGYIAVPFFLLRFLYAGGLEEIIKFCILLVLSGIGTSMIGSVGIIEASHVVEHYHHANKDFFGEAGPYAQLYAINSVCFCSGLTVGPLVAGWLRDSIGYGNMNAVLAGWCILICIWSFFYMGPKPKLFSK